MRDDPWYEIEWGDVAFRVRGCDDEGDPFSLTLVRNDAEDLVESLNEWLVVSARHGDPYP